MIITIEGQEVTVPFNFKALKALTKKLKVKSVEALGPLLEKINYDNTGTIIHLLLTSGGWEGTEDYLEDYLPGNAPVELQRHLMEAITGKTENELVEIQQAVSEGN